MGLVEEEKLDLRVDTPGDLQLGRKLCSFGGCALVHLYCRCTSTTSEQVRLCLENSEEMVRCRGTCFVDLIRDLHRRRQELDLNALEAGKFPGSADKIPTVRVVLPNLANQAHQALPFIPLQYVILHCRKITLQIVVGRELMSAGNKTAYEVNASF